MSLAEKRGSRLGVTDARSGGAKQVLTFTATLTSEQRAAADELARDDLGVLVAPPGTGKVLGSNQRRLSRRSDRPIALFDRHAA
jgi:hypothetical protein